MNLWLNYCVHLPRLIGFGDIYWVKRLDQSWISDYCDWEHRFNYESVPRRHWSIQRPFEGLILVYIWSFIVGSTPNF